VPDDIITLGVPERRSRRDADESIESLFRTHYPHIVYTAFALVGDWDLAEQLAQEAYLRLWRRWRWIADPRARSMERPSAVADPAAVVELRRAITALPARKRECVVLRYLLGLSEAETAGLLDVSIGTVKSQTHKGLRQLRALLDEMTEAGSAIEPEGTAT